MTKHDYQAALKRFNFLFPPIPDGGNSADKNQREMRDSIRHALKTMAIVTGEPSEGMIDAAYKSEEEMDKDPVWWAGERMEQNFKDMIAEVLRLDGERQNGNADSGYALLRKTPEMARLIRDLKAQRDMAVEALEGVLGCRSYDEHGEFHGWRISAGASHGGGLTQRAIKADETLAKIKSDEWVG